MMHFFSHKMIGIDLLGFFKSTTVLLVQFTSHYACAYISGVLFLPSRITSLRRAWKQTLNQRIYTITKKGSKKKSKASGENSVVEIISGTRTETKFEDTKEIIGITIEFNWR